jgi:hypothetical protein
MGRSALRPNVALGNALNIVCRGVRFCRLASGSAAPLPVANFGQVVAVFGDVASVVEQFFTDRPLRIGCARPLRTCSRLCGLSIAGVEKLNLADRLVIG